MLLERAQLEEMKMAELRVLNAQSGGEPVLPHVTKEELINRMLLEVAKQPQSTIAKKEPVSHPICTIEEVIKAVNPYILRGMKVFHDKESNCWLFRVQLKGIRLRDSNTGEIRTVDQWRDDSGTLNQSLNTIKRCADLLMQGVTGARQVEKPFNPNDRYTAVA